MRQSHSSWPHLQESRFHLRNSRPLDFFPLYRAFKKQVISLSAAKSITQNKSGVTEMNARYCFAAMNAVSYVSFEMNV